MADDIVIVCTLGSPGLEASAVFSPLDRGDCIDVGKMIEEELSELPVDPTLPVRFRVVHDGVPVLFNGKEVYFERIVNG